MLILKREMSVAVFAEHRLSLRKVHAPASCVVKGFVAGLHPI